MYVELLIGNNEDILLEESSPLQQLPENMTNYTIRPARIADLEGYNACLASVALELKFIELTNAPRLENSRNWMKSLLEAKCPFLVALDNDKIVGWCDVYRREREGFAHTAELGIGLRSEVRGKGLGSRLLERAIALSKAAEIEKIELEVFASNTVARNFYGKFGFLVEGTKIKSRKLRHQYDDIVLMALFLTDIT